MWNSRTINKQRKWISIGAALAFAGLKGDAADLTIQLAGSSIVRHVVNFECDSEGAKLGLPAKEFPVEYVNGGGNSLAILPIGGHPLIFVSVITGSGARYASDRFIWWDAGSRGVHLSTDSLDGKQESSCHRVDHH